jgi:glycosyltransferase involved in cell wall biosynthesis
VKVLHVIPAMAARYGGPTTAVLGMGRALIAAGTEVLIATTDADGSDRLAVPEGELITHDGVPAVVFRRRASESFKWSPSLARWLNAHVSEFDLAHVHAVFSHSSLAAGRACRRAEVPYLVRPLGTLDPWSLEQHAWRKKALLATSARRLLGAAAAVHYTSAEEQRLAERQMPWLAPGTVIPLGIDDEAFANPDVASVGRSDVVVALGRLHPKKGIDLLIQAFHRLAAVDSLRAWRLRVAGDGPAAYVAGLERIARAGPAADRIEFAGWIDPAHRGALLRSSALFVLPSHQENFGIALVEAMAAGVPAIVTPGVNLAKEIAEAGAGWVAERTASGLTESLGAALGDRRALAERGRAARVHAERFRWSVVAAQLRTGYLQVMRAASLSGTPAGH